MALGLLLWVSCISLLLNFSVGLTAKKAYRVIEDSNNLQDDGDDDALNSQEQDQASNEHLARVGWASYNHPLFAQWQDLVSTQQNQPTTPSVPAVQKLVTGDLSRWRPKNQPNAPSVPAVQGPATPEWSHWRPKNQPNAPSVPAVQEPVTGDLSHWRPKNQPKAPSVPAVQGSATHEWSHWWPQNQPKAPSSPAVQEPVTSGWKGFQQQNLPGPLVFPLRANQPAAPQPPNQDIPPTPSSGVHAYSPPVYPSGGDAGRYASRVASHQPVSSPTVEEPWRPGPVNGQYGVPQPGVKFQHQDSNSQQGDYSSSHPNLVFERVFQLPPNNEPHQGFDAASHMATRQGQANLGQGSSAGYPPTVQQQPPSNAAVPPFYNFWRGLPSAPFHFRGGHFNAMSQRPRNQVFRTQRVMPVQRARLVQSVSQPTASHRHRPTYLYRSRSGYHRGRFLHSHTSYKPEYLQDTISVTSFTGFQEPPESQPPAPKA